MSILGINENGVEQTYNLDEFLGKRVVLYFYPKDNTAGCTQEACDFRDSFNRLIMLLLLALVLTALRVI